MQTALGLVFPSGCREGFPLVYAEALSAGLPVLAFEGSAVTDLVVQDGTGAVATWDKPIRDQLSLTAGISRLHCRAVFDEKYSESAFVERATATYHDVIAESSARFSRTPSSARSRSK
jgi:glycosyltransferase involved in cell wall biosynthesis